MGRSYVQNVADVLVDPKVARTAQSLGEDQPRVSSVHSPCPYAELQTLAGVAAFCPIQKRRSR